MVHTVLFNVSTNITLINVGVLRKNEIGLGCSTMELLKFANMLALLVLKSTSSSPNGVKLGIFPF